MKKILQDAIVQMVRIGNKVNWNEPIDNDYVNALNGLRALLEATQQSVQLTGGTLPDLQALSQPEVLSGLEADTTPPTSN